MEAACIPHGLPHWRVAPALSAALILKTQHCISDPDKTCACVLTHCPHAADLNFASGSALGPCPSNADMCDKAGTSIGSLQCFADCNGQGSCVRGTCKCYTGYVGEFCEQPICWSDAQCVRYGPGTVRSNAGSSIHRASNSCSNVCDMLRFALSRSCTKWRDECAGVQRSWRMLHVDLFDPRATSSDHRRQVPTWLCSYAPSDSPCPPNRSRRVHLQCVG